MVKARCRILRLQLQRDIRMNVRSQSAVGTAPLYRKSDDIPIIVARAKAFQHFGHFAEAELGYKKVLKKRPNHFEALHMLGVCAHRTGDSATAERLLKRALLLDPQSSEVRLYLGIVLAALQRQGEALVRFDELIAAKADFVDAHFNKGSVLLGLGRFPEAIESFDRTIALDPQHVNALIDKGRALHELGRFAEAITCCDMVLAVKPAHVSALVNRGAAFKDSRQAGKAVPEFDLALSIDPNSVEAWVNRGEAMLVLRRLDQALTSYDRALSVNPRLVPAWLGRANILMLTGKLTDAMAACKHALTIEPHSVKGLTQLGQCHMHLGDAKAAVACLDRALAIKPDDNTALSSKIFTEDFSADGDFARHQAARSEWWRQIGSRIAKEHQPRHDNDRDPARRIVLGYVSAEFRRRSAAYSYRPVLENHDKAQFEVICYSNTSIEDDVTESFRRVADRWRSVSQWSDDQLADCIRTDKGDILIDLSGHGDGNRLGIFARKPAPVQVTAWGHATGTGMPTIDYLFSDPVMLPSEARHLFAEQIYDLPCTIFIEPPKAELRSSEPPVAANGHLTYGVFNRVSKFSDAAIATWSRVLQSDVTARLLLKDHKIEDPGVRSMLLGKFATHGIAPDRISLMGSTSREEHLATLASVDVCLDPFPQGGGVSTWEMLYMGVPVVAKLGNGIPSRLGGAILSAVGLNDWVADGDDQYVEIALRATADRLRKIRRELPEMINQRCNPAAYTRAVEEAYRAMWLKRCGESQN
jgi:predicted O-linked N-acetylglucosamine transferase (SPINDLY family)